MWKLGAVTLGKANLTCKGWFSLHLHLPFATDKEKAAFKKSTNSWRKASALVSYKPRVKAENEKQDKEAQDSNAEKRSPESKLQVTNEYQRPNYFCTITTHEGSTLISIAGYSHSRANESMTSRRLSEWAGGQSPGLISKISCRKLQVAWLVSLRRTMNRHFFTLQAWKGRSTALKPVAGDIFSWHYL